MPPSISWIIFILECMDINLFFRKETNLGEKDKEQNSTFDLIFQSNDNVSILREFYQDQIINECVL